MNNQKFAREFAKLNSEQKKAVETIEGPVMVLAGPGTGKTQIVALRIAQILAKTHSGARNILALTFTEAGVTALRERLIFVIGADAYQVTITTFHGFANEIISTFPYAFELPVTTNNLDELETHRIIDKIIRTLPKLDLLRPIRLPTFHVPTIISAIKTLKQEAISPEKLQKLVTKNQLEERKNATKAEVEAADRQANILNELVIIYRKYQKYLREHQVYDYEDMILFVLQSLSLKQEIKQYLQERYQYILVDEYQDTNNAQNILVETLTDFFDTPNLFVVGDDKQAIYRFQGASVANMFHFGKKYPDINVIALQENYRNPKLILESATRLIANNQQQLSIYLKKDIVLRSSSRRISPPRFITFSSVESQYAGIIEQCQSLIKKGLDPKKIAVLIRSNREVKEFQEIAESFGLIVAGAQSADLSNEPVVRALLSILRAINEPTNNHRLLAALPYLKTEVTAVEISEALTGVKHHRALINELISQRRLPGVSQAAKTLRDLIISQKSVDLLKLILLVVEKCCLTNSKNDIRQIDRLEVIHAFLTKTEQLIARQSSLTLDELIEYFQLLRDYQISIPVRRAATEQEGVFVSTIHGAKGLEFEVVFMANVGANSWKVRPHRSIIKLPSSIAGINNWQEDQLEDERRLFYVAMTRARQELILTMGQFRDDGQEILPCQFVVEIDAFLKKEIVAITTKSARQLLTNLLMPISLSQLTERQNNFIKEKISQSPFSFTHYRSYLICPRQYLLRNVLKLPEPPSFALQYGSAVHKAFELYFKQYMQTKIKPAKDCLVQSFILAISRALAGVELKKTILKGTDLLSRYFDQKSASWLMPVGVEYNFFTHHIQLNDIWLTGKFDRIDPIDPIARTVRVIDYKTSSKPKTRGQIEGRTKDSEGEIRQQLVFYALLAKHDRIFPFNVRELAINYVDDAGKFIEEIFTVDAAEIKVLEENITAVYQEIQARKDFPHLNKTSSLFYGESGFGRGCELCALF